MRLGRTTKEERTYERFRDLRASCKRKQFPFNIEYSDLEWSDVYPILGFDLNYFNDRPLSNSPSIDRKDNTQGYVKGNVWIISRQANAMKSSATKDELIKFASWVNSCV